MSDWIEVFKAGKHIDSSGKEHTYSDEDIENIANKYNSQKEHQAPAVLGHPKDNDPAYAWAEEAKAEKGKLLVKFKDAFDGFKKMVNDGMFKNRSISLYPDGLIRHIGFLGAVPPAVKGMAAAHFSDDDEYLEFMDWETAYDLNSVGSVFQRLREWLIDKFSREEADQIIPNYEIENLKNAKETKPAENKVKSSFSEINQEDVEMTEEQVNALVDEKLNAQKEELETSFNEQIEAKDQKIKELEEANGKLIEEQKEKEFRAFCESLELTPAKTEKAVAIMKALDGQGEIEFSENENTEKISPLDLYKKQLSSNPKEIEFSEVATKDKAVEPAPVKSHDYGENVEIDDERAEIHAKAKALAKEKNISYAEALKQIEI